MPRRRCHREEQHMKKFIGVFAAGIMAASLLAGCGSTSSAASSSATAAGSVAAAAMDADGDGRILVLYYSASGNTKNIADMIAADTGADEFGITPSQPYTSEDLNYGDDNSRVVKEHEDESLQDVAFDSYDIPDWDSYDTVFVGYPIWWQDASWVMKSYVQHVDFTGKTVIPFCTSSASGIGESGQNLAALAGAGDWHEGQRFSGHASADEVSSWANSLGF